MSTSNDTPKSSEVISILSSAGLIALVDSDDADLLDAKWYFRRRRNTFYMEYYIKSNGKRITSYIHRAILSRKLERELLPSEQVDHIDGNGLNNCRSNLRLANCSQNQGNRRISKNNTSGYKGVHFHKRVGGWTAEIRKDGKRIHLGTFETPELAYEAYCEAAKLHFGEFARLK